MVDYAKELNLVPDKNKRKIIDAKLKIIVNEIKSSISDNNIDADIFIGGSYAKGTILNKDEQDIDIFVRFDWKYQDLSEPLEKVIKDVSKKLKLDYERLHGSRDYYRIMDEKIFFEIIPVLRIKKPHEARNVTDLSYFHVNYAKSKISENIAKEILVAKTFCKAQGVYGAESYIAGFSGYALECLIIYYKNFENMLKKIVKAKERIVLDPAKHYKNEDEILVNLNESKTMSPIILIDPTFKDRNVLAALSEESFNRFKESANAFLKKKSISFFSKKEVDPKALQNEAKKSKWELVSIEIKTDKQKGDIAGTKLKKFSNFIIEEVKKYYIIKKNLFVYDNQQKANIYLILDSKKEIAKIGPPIEMKENVKAFKKANKRTFIKDGYIHSSIRISYSAKRFLSNWAKKFKKKTHEMDIMSFSVK